MNAFRMYHLFFALAVATAYLTAEDLGLVHAWAGYAIAAAFALRGVLGLMRAKGFRFARLLPRSGGGNLVGLRSPIVAHGLTLALFGCIAGSAATGIALDQGGTLVGKSIRLEDEHEGGEEESELASLFGLIGSAHAESEEGEEGEEEEEGPLQEVHETFGSLLLPIAAAHILYMLFLRTDLARFILFLRRGRGART